jgi:hypothetical protein
MISKIILLGLIMQTVAVQIQDDYVQNFMNYVNNHSENITVARDHNLELDPYFYERKRELNKIRDDIRNDKIEMVSHKTVWGNVKQHLKTIKN